MGLEDRIMQKLASGITTQDRQIERSDSYNKNYTADASVEEINFVQRLRSPTGAAFVRIVCSANATMKYKKVGEDERDFDEGITGAIPLLWRNESLEYIKIHPAAYPTNVIVYSSGYSSEKPTK